MPKTFEYKDAKEQIQYYKKLLVNLKKGLTFSSNCQNELKHQIQILHSYNFFSKLVEEGIKGKSINFDDANLEIFLANIYYFKEGSKLTDVCNSLISAYESQVKQYIANLSPGSNALFWFFSSKKKKSSAIEAYDELVKMRESSFVASSIEVLKLCFLY